jgi:hypothetical protein
VGLAVGISVWYKRSTISALRRVIRDNTPQPADWRWASPDARVVMWGAKFYVGRQGTSDRYTDGQVWGSPHTGAKVAFYVGIVEPNSNSHSARSGCNQPFLNVNAGTRDEEREKVKRYKVLCNQRGLTFVPIIFTTCDLGHGRGFPTTNLAPTLEEGRGTERTLR